MNAAAIPAAAVDGAAHAPLPANNPRLHIAQPPFALRPTPAEGAQLVPLAGFSWSGPGWQPRARGDHVVIWRAVGADQPAEITLAIGGVRLPVPPGSLSFVPAGTAFALSARAGCAGAIIIIPRSLAADLPLALPARPTAGAVSRADATTLLAVVDSLTLGPPPGLDRAGRRAAMLAGIAPLPVTLSRLGQQPAAPRQANGPQPEEARALLARFTDLAANEVGRGRTLGELAAELGTTAAALDRAALQLRGQRALDVIYRLRIDRAVAALRDGAQPPTRIAQDLGFASLAHMSRVLTEATGRGPEAFRQGRG